MIQEEADRVRLERKAKMREIKENISNRYGLLVIIMVNRISANQILFAKDSFVLYSIVSTLSFLFIFGLFLSILLLSLVYF